MSDYAITPSAIGGVKVPLCDLNSNETGDWLKIRGTDSDQFQIAEDQAHKARLGISGVEDDEQRIKLRKQIRCTLLASLIADWSFDEECTFDSAYKLVSDAPQIAEAIDEFAANRENFIAKKSKRSKSSVKSSYLWIKRKLMGSLGVTTLSA